MLCIVLHFLLVSLHQLALHYDSERSHDFSLCTKGKKVVGARLGHVRISLTFTSKMTRSNIEKAMFIQVFIKCFPHDGSDAPEG